MAGTLQTLLTAVMFDYEYAPDGNPLKNARVEIRLAPSPQPINANPLVSLNPQPIIVYTDPTTGYWSATLVRNDQLTQTGTYYTVKVAGREPYLMNVPAAGGQASSNLVNAPSQLAPGTTNLTGPLTVGGALTVSGLLTANAGIVATTVVANGLITANAGLTVVAGQVTSLMGNVGIGTASPASLLHLEGAGTTGAPVAGTGAALLRDTGGGVGNGYALIFAYAGTTTGYAAIKGYVQSGANNTTGDIVFYGRTVATDANLTEHLRLTTTGHLLSSGSAPTVAANVAMTGLSITGGGSSGTATDHRGRVTFTLTNPTSAGQVLATITFANPFVAIPVVVGHECRGNGGPGCVAYGASATQFQIVAQGVYAAASQIYFDWIALG